MIYLDNAATSRFKPRSMFDEMFAQLAHSSNPGRGGHNDAIDTAIKLYDVRTLLKNIVGGDDGYEVIFTSGCTEAANLAILGYLGNFKGQPAEVIFTSYEHNSVARPLWHLKETLGIKLIEIKPDKDGRIPSVDINDAINENTRLVCVNHISNVTGYLADIEEIGKVTARRGVPLFVDGAQSLGHVAVNVKDLNISFLAAAGHKGLHGSQGTGFLVYDKRYRMLPIRFGGTGSHSESLSQPDLPPDSFETGTLNSAGLIGLGASADWTYKNLNNVALNIRYLTSELIYGLKQIKNVRLYSSQNNGVVSFNFGDYSSTDIGDYLNERDIAVRCGLHCAPLIHRQLGTLECGTVRASVGYNNTINDVRALLNAIDRLNYKKA